MFDRTEEKRIPTRTLTQQIRSAFSVLHRININEICFAIRSPRPNKIRVEPELILLSDSWVPNCLRIIKIVRDNQVRTFSTEQRTTDLSTPRFRDKHNIVFRNQSLLTPRLLPDEFIKSEIDSIFRLMSRIRICAIVCDFEMMMIKLYGFIPNFS